MWFCPLDGTLLQIAPAASASLASDSSNSVFVCPTCPYARAIARSYVNALRPERKAVDDVMGGAAAWENVDRTAAVCGKCSHGEAYFMQMQIRSADEPMSVFYKCCKCSHQWNDK
mmetsp:Transcript_15459/g.29390  ORF Transcript_15459/g.29390 Transcript_15459/m.29390 type:complete len:115 (-) Transcript_15459:4-348(-)